MPSTTDTVVITLSLGGIIIHTQIIPREWIKGKDLTMRVIEKEIPGLTGSMSMSLEVDKAAAPTAAVRETPDGPFSFEGSEDQKR